MNPAFHITYNGLQTAVTVTGDNHDRIFTLHLPGADQQFIQDIDEEGEEHWIEKDKGETDFASVIGELIESTAPSFVEKFNNNNEQ